MHALQDEDDEAADDDDDEETGKKRKVIYLYKIYTRSGCSTYPPRNPPRSLRNRRPRKPSRQRRRARRLSMKATARPVLMIERPLQLRADASIHPLGFLSSSYGLCVVNRLHLLPLCFRLLPVCIYCVTSISILSIYCALTQTSR